MPKSAQKKSKYSPHPGLAKEQEDKDKLRAATGKSFDDWIDLARKQGPKSHKELQTWLREKHGHASRTAWWLAATAVATDDEASYTNAEGLVDALYSGPKAALRPIHEKVVDAALACGADVIATSCKTMVPLYRKHVFAELTPKSAGVEVQLSIGDAPADGRLQLSDGRQPGDRLTHRVLLAKEADVDVEFKGWLAKAYENGAGKLKRAETSKTPADLAKSLKASPKAAATWDTCTPAMQRDWIQWIESAKQQETRERRLATTIDRLAAGKKKNY